jgi:hypothetical protein
LRHRRNPYLTSSRNQNLRPLGGLCLHRSLQYLRIFPSSQKLHGLWIYPSNLYLMRYHHGICLARIYPLRKYPWIFLQSWISPYNLILQYGNPGFRQIYPLRCHSG